MSNVHKFLRVYIHSKKPQEKPIVLNPLETNSPCKTRTGFQKPQGLRDMKNITDLIAFAVEEQRHGDFRPPKLSSCWLNHHLKNHSQIRSSPQVGAIIETIKNHHLAMNGHVLVPVRFLYSIHWWLGLRTKAPFSIFIYIILSNYLIYIYKYFILITICSLTQYHQPPPQ